MTVQEAIELHLKPLKERAFAHTTEKALDMAIKCMKEVEQYRALGTVEELKEAREKQVAKKPRMEYLDCDLSVTSLYPTCQCGNQEIGEEDNYCNKCGQKLKWSNEE